MRRLRGFGHFWYDFVVGDDWRLALSGATALGACGLLSHLDVTSWWLVPAVVVGTLTLTLIRMVPPAPAGGTATTTPTVRPGPSGSLPLSDPERVGPTTEVEE
jgi:hypothetical protein